MFAKRIKHTKRYQEILNAFFRNGLSHFLFRIGITERAEKRKGDQTNMNQRDVGKKLRHTLQQLGPSFIKVGQIASTRRDMIPDAIAFELEKLQDDVRSFSYEEVKQMITSELGDTPENLFKTFETEPLATASIGQVHIARLFSDEEVAIKVQRQDIRRNMEIDLEILYDIATFLEDKTAWAKRYKLLDMVTEYSDSLRNELNYTLEGRNAEQMNRQFSNDESVHIPKIHWEFSSPKVLTMEMVRGIKVNHLDKLEENSFDNKVLARRLTDAMFKQVLQDGFFHGDPHAGNIYILPGHVISFLDFGMVGHLNNQLKYHFASLILSVQKGDTKGILKTFSAMEILDDVINEEALYRDINHLQVAYYHASLEHISLGNILMEIFSIAYKHHIEIPSDITILAKVILTLESLIEKLDPTFSIMKAIEPFGKELVRNRYNPKYFIQNSWDEIRENLDILRRLPRDIKSITSSIRKGKLKIDINVTDLKSFLHRLDKISNRLSFSIILLAFSILMAGLIIGASISGQTTLIWKLPVIELGFVVASIMFLFMIYSIIKSGRM